MSETATQDRTIPIYTLQALEKGTSKDMARPILTHVGIRDGKAIAADGFILISTSVEGFGEPLNIDATALLAVSKAVKRADRFEFADDTVTIANGDPDKALTIDILCHPDVRDTSFPDAGQILASADYSKEPTVAFTVNARLLKQLCDAAIKAGSESGRMTFTVPIERKHTAIPITFDGAAGEEFNAVIMPMVG